MCKNVKIRIHKTIILPVVLCGYEMWCLALRRDHRLWVFRGQGAEDNISIDEG
jgi:hypothetical protein